MTRKTNRPDPAPRIQATNARREAGIRFFIFGPAADVKPSPLQV
jgi:hypothetical protein